MDKFSKEINLEITTIQVSDSEKTSFVNNYTGKMFFKDGTFHIYYDEKDDTLDKTIKSVIHASRDKVEICRDGAYATNIIYEKGKVYKTVYKMPYGELPMTVKPGRVLTALDENGGKICLDYEMSLSGQMFNNSITIRMETK